MITILLAVCSLHTVSSPAELGLTMNRPAAGCQRAAAELNRYYQIETPGNPSAMFDLYWRLGTLRSGAVACVAVRRRDRWRIAERSSLGASYAEQLCSNLRAQRFSVSYRPR